MSSLKPAQLLGYWNSYYPVVNETSAMSVSLFLSLSLTHTVTLADTCFFHTHVSSYT